MINWHENKLTITIDPLSLYQRYGVAVLSWAIHNKWKAISLLASAGVLAVMGAAMVVNVAPNAIGKPVIQQIGTNNIVPALGADGYTASTEFCQDPLTVVKPLIIPDVSGYELTRSKDNKSESIAVVFNGDGEPVYAKFSADGLTIVPAVVNAEFRKCLQERAK